MLNKEQTMLTTKQVREIMREHGKGSYEMYTNKTRGDTSNRRRVKCYYRSGKDYPLLEELIKAAGADNVMVTKGSDGFYTSGMGLVVKCVLAL